LLKLIDVAKKSLDLVAALVEFLIQLGVHLLPSINLSLKIFDCAVNITKRALLGAILILLLFKVGLQL
jgi:hypothetical protein